MPSDSNPLDVTITFPIFNEKTALRQCVLDMQEAMDRLPYSYEILLVDDGSSDGGLATVADLDVRTIRHIRNMGGAMARLTGIRYARGNIILQSDADGTYAVDAIGVMLEKINHCDLVIGARKRESATDWRWMRIITKWLMRKLAELLSGAKIPDLNSGMRVYRKEPALRFAHLYPKGHSIMSTMTLAFLTNGLVVEFHPIDYYVRIGKSSFHPIRDTFNYLTTTVRTVAFFRPLRVMLPFATVLAAAALFFTIRNLIDFGILGRLPQLLWISSALIMGLGVLADQMARLSRQIIFLDNNHWPDRHIIEETPDAKTTD
ncbi:MAG: glycosyltransferase family 2 protein [Rhodospirillales bacterium]